MKSIRCPECKNHLLQKSGGTEQLRVQGALTFTAQGLKAQCYWCKESVTLSLGLREIRPERLVLDSDKGFSP